MKKHIQLDLDNKIYKKPVLILELMNQVFMLHADGFSCHYSCGFHLK